MYKIKYEYRTGDTFSTRDESDVLDYEWDDFEVAKRALQRINEHYKWYMSRIDSYSFSPKELQRPEWHKKVNKKDYPTAYHNLIILEMDDGEEVQFWAPWCGYFESLHSAEIVISERIEF